MARSVGWGPDDCTAIVAGSMTHEREHARKETTAQIYHAPLLLNKKTATGVSGRERGTRPDA